MILGALLIFSILLSLVAGENVIFEYATQQMLIYVFGTLLSIFVYIMMVNNPVLLRGMGYIVGGWLAICLLFFVISAYYYYVLDSIPFLASMSEDQLKSARAGRMMLPAVKPPHLSVEMVLIFFWLFFMYLVKKSFYRLSLGVIAVIICLLTFSRSGFVSLVLTFGTSILVGSSLRLTRLNTYLFGAFLSLGLLAALYPVAAEFFYRELNISGLRRLQNIDLETLQHGRHLDLRYQALEIFSRASLIEKAFGIGVGQFRTEGYGPYAFSLYLTALAEQGIFGAILTLALFWIPVFLSLARLINPGTRSIPFLLVFSISLAMALSNLFYELKNAFPIWIFLGWAFAMVNSHPPLVLQSFQDLLPGYRFIASRPPRR